jgi:hypothetical protein
MASEDKFPTIRDLRDRLTHLVELGLGDLPVQVVIVPGSTMVAVARATHPDQMKAAGKPPLMIEFDGQEGRMPPTMVSCDFLDTKKYPLPLRTQ